MTLTPQQAAQELLRRRKARRSLIDFSRFIEVPGAPVNEADEDTEDFLPVETELAAHHILILEAAQRCVEKHMGRLMIFMPPGAAKSTYGSQVVPAFVMGNKKNYRVIGVSYNSTLARKMGRRTRSIVKQNAFKTLFDCELSNESSAAEEWALTNGSEYLGGGILSGITGNRADLIVIDDPIRGRQDADSEVIRQNVMDAYQDDVLTRLKPGGSVVIIQTRWNQADVAGTLLPEDYDGRSGTIMGTDGQEWEVLCLPAQAEREDDPLGRKPGEYLWPEWFDEAHWQQYRRNTRTWSALYQQRPAPEEGDYFKLEWLHEYTNHPPLDIMKVYMGSDYAVTSDGGDYTVHIVVGVDPAGRMWLLDMWRKQASSDVWVEAWCDLVKDYKPSQAAEETGQIKSGVGPFLTKRARERQVYTWRRQFPTRGDKAVRAQSIRGRMAMNGLMVPRTVDAPWMTDLRAELASFPAGRHDDIVDALGLVGQLLDLVSSGKAAEIKDTLKEPNFVGVGDGTIQATMSIRDIVRLKERKRNRR